MNKISHFFTYRPLSVLAICAALRDILFGFGVLYGVEQVTRTLLFMNFNSLVPGVSGLVFGALFVVVGLIVIWSCLYYKRRFISLSLRLQAGMWLFSTLMYVVNGHFLLALMFGLLFSFPAGYTSMYIKHRPPADHDGPWLSEEEVDDEPQSVVE